MKKLTITLFVLIQINVFGQHNSIDTTTVRTSIEQAKQYFAIGDEYYYSNNFDSSSFYFLKAAAIYRKNAEKTNNSPMWEEYINCLFNISYNLKSQFKADENLNLLDTALVLSLKYLGEKNAHTANLFDGFGDAYVLKAYYDKALDYYFKALGIRKELLSEINTKVAVSYNNIGQVYAFKDDYDKALENLLKGLEIFIKILGEKNDDVAFSYTNIGIVYFSKGEFDKALEYTSKGLKIRLELFGDKNADVASSYNNIGVIYCDKAEYEKALEFHFKCLAVYKEILGEKHPYTASSYNNIGIVYFRKGLSEKALEYYFKSLEIRKELLGEKHIDVAGSYNNIGQVYDFKADYNKALEYYFKGLEIKKNLLGEKHTNVAMTYVNIGKVYYNKGNYDEALEYLLKAIKIENEMIGQKHPLASENYTNIGNVYNKKCEYNLALEYYHKGVASSLRNFNETTNNYSVPKIADYFTWNELLRALQAKAEIISEKNKILQGPTNNERKKIALRHFQACDTLIDITRREISSQSDKLALGELANQIYKAAIVFLTTPQYAGNNNILENTSPGDANLAFYFSEKNKSSVLLEALAGQEAIKFAGIPDSLLQKEHNLKIEINFYTKRLAEPENLDSGQVTIFQSRLFLKNRSYDSLILFFEKQFPEYHNLKYNNKTATVKDVQKLIDENTAMLSYIIGDSTITIFTLTKNKFDVQQVPMMVNLNDSIFWFRLGLTNTSLRMQENYRRLGFKLYQQLIPVQVIENNQIEKLIIIPDGELAIIPFEALLTTKYTGDINLYNEYPYLVKKYSISYTYSASLFNLTFSRQASSIIEIKQLNDWLALAPVFDNDNVQNMVMSSRELQRQLNGLQTDSLMTNRSIFDRNYINPLPATETEAEAIFSLYNDKDLKAKVLLRNMANEHYIKTGALEQFKVIHFATHGFVNSERPELSGLLLEQDTTGGEDGILYSGELYNLKMNADLVVLSACETGLGKIRKGEGIIGLTRALLYAGAKNIVVSLWQVSDKSTSDLMIDFYKNITENEKQNHSKSLQQAKLKMINESNYAHPFYWSPFILIGK